MENRKNIKPDNARKFLLQGFPDAAYLAEATKIRTGSHGWLRKGEREMKVSGYEEAGEYFLTEKVPDADGRNKGRSDISQEVFDMLFGLTDGARIRKACHMFDEDGLALRFDDFLDPTAMGMIRMLEVDGSRAAEWQLPDEAWARGAVEVTHDPRYLNQNLAL